MTEHETRKLLEKALAIHEMLTSLNDDMYKVIQDHLVHIKENPKNSNAIDNIRCAREWTEKADRKLQLAIRNLKNENEYNKLLKGD